MGLRGCYQIKKPSLVLIHLFTAYGRFWSFLDFRSFSLLLCVFLGLLEEGWGHILQPSLPTHVVHIASLIASCIYRSWLGVPWDPSHKYQCESSDSLTQNCVTIIRTNWLINESKYELICPCGDILLCKCFFVLDLEKTTRL